MSDAPPRTARRAAPRSPSARDKKPTVVILVAVFIAALLAACAPPAESNGGGGKSKEIVAIFYTKTLEYYNTMLMGMENEAEEKGYTLTAQHANLDVAEQQELFRTAVAKKPAGIILGPMQADAWGPTLQVAKDAGVPVILVANDVPEESRDLRLTQIGVQNYDVGEAKAEWLVDQLGGEGDVLVIHFLRGHPYTEDQRRAYTEVFDANPGINVIEGPYAVSTEEAIRAMENALAANDTPDAVFFDLDDGAIGGLQALEERGITDIITASSDGTNAGVDAVAAGDLDLTVSIRPYETGTTAVDAMVAYLEDGTEPEDPISFPPLMITKNTVADVPPEELGQDPS